MNGDKKQCLLNWDASRVNDFRRVLAPVRSSAGFAKNDCVTTMRYLEETLETIRKWFEP